MHPGRATHARLPDAGLPAVRRLLAAVLAAVQLLLAFSPLLDRDAGESAQVHVEAQGIQLHWSHDSAECAGCSHRHLTATPATAPVALALVAVDGPALLRTIAAVAASAPHSSLHSRAPPTVS
jgi:hypothetical protein